MMKQICISKKEVIKSLQKTKLFLVLFFAVGLSSYAQVTTNSSSGLAGTYPSLAAAITALNGATIVSPVTITLTVNETAPIGGYSITAQGTAVNTIIISGVTSTITASAAQVSGSLTDAVFKLVGADFVTIQNFIIQENASNSTTAELTNNMTEFGVGLFYATATNGAQNNIIQNNTISLNRSYSNTFGVYSSTRHTATSLTIADITVASGSNSGNRISKNTVSNVSFGVVFTGANTAAAMDNSNVVGGTVVANANTFTNWGGLVSGAISLAYPSVTTSCVGVFMNHQINEIVSFNTLTSATNITTLIGTSFLGILKDYSVTQPTGTITANYNNNTITLTNAATTSQMSCITLGGLTTLATATFNCNNNSIINCVQNGGSATSAAMIGMLHSSAPGIFNITNNTIRGFSSTATASGGFIGIQLQANGVVNTLNISDNKFGDATAGAVTFLNANSGIVTGINVTSSGAAPTCAVTISNNDFRGIVHNVASTGAQAYISQAAAVTNFTCNQNTFTNLNINTSGSVTMISQSYGAASGTTKTVTNNSIVTAFVKAAAGGTLILVVDGGSSVNGSISECSGNNFSNITVSGTSSITGLSFGESGTTAPSRTVTENTFNNWTAGTGFMTAMNFPRWNGVSSLSNNTISNMTGQGTVTGIVLGSNVNTATSITVAANKINNLSSTGSSANVRGITCTNTSPNIRIIGNIINTLSITGSAFIVGISMTDSNATSGTNIAQNEIYNLTNTSAGGAILAMEIASNNNGVNVIERNLIYDLNATATSGSEVIGIKLVSGANTVRNNIIRFGSGISNAITVNGIVENSSNNSNIFHNSVYIGGSPTAGSGSSYAFNASSENNTRSFRNNIFFNARSNAGATGKNYAVKVGGTTANPTGLTINNNVYFANGTGAVFGFFNGSDSTNFTAWKTAVGQDANSVNSNPLYTSTTDLNLQSSSPAINVGANLGVPNDFAGQTRPGANLLFDIGADERDGIALPVNDMQATAFISPANAGVRVQNISFMPEASFTNNGSANLTNITVRYRILNPSSVVVYNQTVVVPFLYNSLSTPVVFPAAVLTAVGTHTIFAKAELAGDSVTTNDEISGTLNVLSQLNGTYTVGTGGNYTSLTNVGGLFEDMNFRGVSANVTVNIISDLTGENGATFLNEFAAPFTVTIKPSGAARAITGSSAGGIITLNSADRVTIDGALSGNSRDLTITNTNTGTASSVIFMQNVLANGASNNTVRNCNIVGNANTTTQYGIFSLSNGTGSGNNNNSFINNNVTKVQNGIGSFGSAMTTKNTGTIISQNTITGTGANSVGRSAIYATFEDGITISGNNIANVLPGTSVDGFGIACGSVSITTVSFGGSEVINATVTNNIIDNIMGASNRSAAGIYFSTTTNSGTNLIANNIISNTSANCTGADLGVGILVGGGAGTTNIYHNSVSITGTTTGGAGPNFGIAIGGSNPIVNIRNNIFFNSAVNGATLGLGVGSYAIGYGYSTFTNLTVNNNDYFTSGTAAKFAKTGSLATASGTDAATLAALQTAIGQDAASLSVSPAFTSLSNLLPTTCDVDNKGVNIASVTLDITGEARSLATPDIGAYEINGTILGCALVDNIWNGSVWSLGTPTATQKVVFEGNYSQNVNLVGDTFEVRNNAVVAIPSTFNVTASGPIVVTSGSLTFENNSNLIQTGTNANSGNIVVKRNTAMQRLAYTYWSSPVASQNLLAFSPLTTVTPISRFYTYSEPTGAFVSIATPSTTNFAVGTGYAVRAPNTFADAPAAAQTFMGSFTGVPNNGTITVSGTKASTGDNLVGNPYPCAINALGANGFITVNPSTLYFWTKTLLGAPTASNYASLTSLTGTAATAGAGSATPNGIIQVGQGFFCSVPPTAGASSLEFNNAMKVGNNANQFFRNANATTNTIEKHLIKLNLTSPADNFNQIAIGYMTGATNGFDAGIDGLVFGGGNPTMISSLINGADYVIQGKAASFNVADVVNLGFRAETAGTYTISTAAIEGLFAGTQDFYIKDNLTGTTHNIKQTPYNFVSAAGTFNARFQLVYQTVLGVSNPSIENGLVAYVKNDNINIKSTLNMTDIKVYDASGRLVYEKSKINTQAVELNDLRTAQQMLFIQITADGKTVTKKIVY